MDKFRQDLSFTLRSLRRSPLFTAAALMTLGLGVGVTITMFSVVNGVLLKPLPYAEQSRIFTAGMQWTSRPSGLNPMSKPDIVDMETIPGVESAVGFATGADVLTRDGSATLISGARMTSGILEAFGLDPFMGRDLLLDESYPGQPSVAVVSHSLWETEFGSDPGILGRTIELNGESFEVVGVAPPGFEFPEKTQLWRPSVTSPECLRGCRLYDVVGLLDNSLSMEAAADQISALSDRLSRNFPDSNKGRRIVARSLREDLLGDVEGELWILLGAVALVLLVACANVANLLLARSQYRISEISLRASLGASGPRITRQMLTESLVLAGFGGGLGLILAYLSTAVLRHFAPHDIPRIGEVGVDGVVILFTLGLVLLVALLFGLSPAIHLAAAPPANILQGSSRGGGGSRPTLRFRRILLASEMALSILLLLGAGLLLRTLHEIHRVDPGFQVEDVVRFSLILPDKAYPDLPQITQFYRELEERIQALPTVLSVGSGYGAPMSHWGTSGSVLVSGRPVPEPGHGTQAHIRPITPGYLSANQIPVLQGRGILPSDLPGARPVALVNQAFIHQNFPDQDPLGQEVRITVDMGFGSPSWTVVGILPDVHSRGPTRGASPEVYVPQAQMGPPAMTVVVRSSPDSPPPFPAIREIVRNMDPLVPLRDVETMDQVLAAQTANTRFYLVLLSAFAVLAAALASVGLYGVTAYLVSMQRREIGIRMALGAPRVGIVRMVLAQSAVPTGVGLVMGVAAAMAGAQVFQRFLFQVSPRDPLVYSGVSALLLAVAAFSALLPARQASRVEPGEALREC